MIAIHDGQHAHGHCYLQPFLAAPPRHEHGVNCEDSAAQSNVATGLWVSDPNSLLYWLSRNAPVKAMQINHPSQPTTLHLT